ncbi:hypothetical protein [Candidatus Halobonum tyrrellensis]|uniref:hypothetical protein n=1 Tax=Candidatus Halobonum tyrrellensis TaxID=1431545 RepID=UPI00190FA5DD|nr:hypothetical protein [Candidatus Halobonum tyrrellensis]
MSGSADAPRVCPECGAEEPWTERYTTGGGWRAERRCSNCGYRLGPGTDGAE